MRQAEMYPKGLALDSHIEAAIRIAEVSEKVEISLRRETGDYNNFITPIIANFWVQGETLKALKDFLSNGTKYHTAPALLIESLKGANSAQQAACNAALSVSFILGDWQQSDHPQIEKTGAICEALMLSLEIKRLLKKIRLGLIKEGFPCK